MGDDSPAWHQLQSHSHFPIKDHEKNKRRVGFRGLKKENRREKVLLRLEEKRKETEKREGRELSFFFSLSFSCSIKAEEGEGVRLFLVL